MELIKSPEEQTNSERDAAKFCQLCGACISDSAKVCLECGAAQSKAIPATIKCISCGSEIPKFAKFCEKCGVAQNRETEAIQNDESVAFAPRWLEMSSSGPEDSTGGDVESHTSGNLPLSSATTNQPSESGRVGQGAPKHRKVLVFFEIAAAVIVLACIGAWYLQATARQKARGNYNLGLAYENGQGVAKDNAQAAYKKAADQGDAAAQSKLGDMYRLGRGGLAKDDAQAVNWYRKAAEQGLAKAQCNLGMMYENGEGGLAKDEIQAVSWFRKAAEQGDAGGQYNLAAMYENGGGGLAKNDAQAVSWYQRAAEQGDVVAQNTLGVRFVTGKGVQQDESQAEAWFRKAAEQGYVGAQYNLGKFLILRSQNEREGLHDYAEGISWMDKAAKQGNAQAKSIIDKVKASVSGSTSMEAQKPHLAIKGTPIDFISLYAKAHSTGLEIGKRYQVNAYVNSELTVLHPNESMGTEVMFMEHDFDDPSQIQAEIQKAVSSGRSLYCVVTVSRNARFIPLYIHRAENCR